MCLFIQHNFAQCVHTMEQDLDCQLGPCGKLGRMRSYHQGSCSECSGLSPYEAIRQARIRPDVLLADPKEVNGEGDPGRTPYASGSAQSAQSASFPDDRDHSSEEDEEYKDDLSGEIAGSEDSSGEEDYYTSDNDRTPRASPFAKTSLANPGDKIPRGVLYSGTPTGNAKLKPFGPARSNGPVRNAKHARKNAVDFDWYNRTFKVNKAGSFELGGPFAVPTYEEATAEAGTHHPKYIMHGGISAEPKEEAPPEPAPNVNGHYAAQPQHYPGGNTGGGGAPVPVYYGQAYNPSSPFYLQNHGYMTYAYTLQQLPGWTRPVWVPSPYPVDMAVPPGSAQPYPTLYPQSNQLRRRDAHAHLRGGGGGGGGNYYEEEFPSWMLIKDLGDILPGTNESVSTGHINANHTNGNANTGQAEQVNRRRVRFSPIVSVRWIEPRQVQHMYD